MKLRCNSAAKQVSAGVAPFLCLSFKDTQIKGTLLSPHVNGGQNRRTQAHAHRLEGHANRGEYRNVDFPTKPFFFLPIFIIQHPNLKLPYLLISSAVSTLPMYNCAIMAAPFAPAEKLVYIKKEIKRSEKKVQEM